MTASLPPYTPTPAPYLGQAATRCYAPNQTTGATWSSGRSMHWARTKIVNPVVVFANWSLSSSNVETLNPGGTAKCAIETTLGTRLAQNAEGAVSFVSGYAVCTFPGITIPKGSQFWIDYLIQNTTNSVYISTGFQHTDATEGWSFGSGAVTDFTVSGTPADAFQRSMSYGPTLILSQTTDPSVLLVGTSRATGNADFVTDASSDTGQTARLVGRRHGYTSLALASSTLNTYNAQSKTYRGQMTSGTISGIATGVPYHSHIINEYGINDINGGDTAAATATRRATFAAAYPNHVVIGTTLTPTVSSTDSFTTAANQALGTGEPKVLTFNDLVRTGIAGERGVWDIADLVDPYRSGKWPVSRNPNDTTVTGAAFTAAIAGNVMTVSAVASGTIVKGANVFGTGISTGQQIMSYGTGAGGTGTYNVFLNQTVASESMTTGSIITWDGLHESAATNELIRDRGAAMLNLITR